MKHPLNKYKYYQFKNKNGGITIVATSSYGGKTVKGYAKCDPRDEFDIEKGKALGSHMNVFAIPNSERESNPDLKQNDGY